MLKADDYDSLFLEAFGRADSTAPWLGSGHELTLHLRVLSITLRLIVGFDPIPGRCSMAQGVPP